MKTDRYFIALTVLVWSAVTFSLNQTASSACVAVAALAGLWLADWMNLEESKLTKPSKSLADLQAAVEQHQKEFDEMKSRVSTLSIAQAAKPFMKR